MDYIAVIAQIATSAATLAVAIFLASQLRLQHRDSAESTRTELTSGIVQWLSLIHI